MNCLKCGNNEFVIEAGIYYCIECGVQSQRVEVEYTYDHLQAKESQSKTKISTKQKSNDIQLTTWEEFNYILHGLVNELLKLGAKRELKLTTLQLWTVYLRKINVAFFSKNVAVLPKLSAAYKKKDAHIIYNHRIKHFNKKKKMKEIDPTCLTAKQISRLNKKKQKSFIQSEYDEYIKKTQSSDDTKSVYSTSSAESNFKLVGKPGLNDKPLEFSANARRLLKRKMSKKHIKKHCYDSDRELHCHSLVRRNINTKHQLEIPSRSILLSILYIALNLINDKIQLGDIIRFIREGHINCFNIKKYFPENLHSKLGNISAYFHRGPTPLPSHFHLRGQINNLIKLLNLSPTFKLNKPNLYELCKRYVNELCLPDDLLILIKNLLKLSPSIMNYTKLTKFCPNYEARAMAYILFLLKLIFGLDDVRERKISKSAKLLNKKIKLLNNDWRKLFIWSDWVKYIEMRTIILIECHYPTVLTINENNELINNTHLYLDYLNKIQSDNFDEDNDIIRIDDDGDEINLNINNFDGTLKKYPKVKENMFNNLKNIFKEIILLYERYDNNIDDNVTNLSITFPPSMTPAKSYLKKIMTDKSLKSKLFIPKFMKINHEKRDLMTYIKSERLKNFFNKYNINLSIEKQKCNLKNIYFKNSFLFTEHSRIPSRFPQDYINCTYDIDETEWLNHLKTKELNDMNDKMELERNIHQSTLNNSEYHLKLLNDENQNELNKNNMNIFYNDLLLDKLNKYKIYVNRQKNENLDDIEFLIPTVLPSTNDKSNTNTNITNHKNYDSLSLKSYEYFDELNKDLNDSVILTKPRRNNGDNIINTTNNTDNCDNTELISDESDTEIIETSTITSCGLTTKSSTSMPSMPSIETNNISKNNVDKEKLVFHTSNFDYWIYMGNIALTSRQQDIDNIVINNLPKNFQWLLKQCSRIIEVDERDLYRELLIVENHFAYNLQPDTKHHHLHTDSKRSKIRLKYCIDRYNRLW